MNGIATQDDPPLISALVCTCSRDRSVANTVSSILANTYPNFELIVVDQSKGIETQDALTPFAADRRLTYLKSATIGKGNALNVGLRETKGAIIAITDDDCTVPADWLTAFASIFAANARIAVAFCCVEAGEHDREAGFVPVYVRPGERLLTSMHDARDVHGMGAGIAVRRSMIEDIGGFDPMFGPGSRFPSGDDRDVGIRALVAGYYIYETSSITVKHFGFRTWQQGKSLARRDFLAIGAAYSKLLRCGYIGLAYIPAWEFAKYALWPPIRDLLHLRQPQGLVRMSAFLEGFIKGLRTPLDRTTLRFVDKEQESSIPLKVSSSES
ncbi:Glycosyltransferase like family 2 [Bradyrhizobium erythrophlei]|uniref:Glycosyltransferase like family 2 n=2 Tax=Bradyrhizobium erythrophlei TaxID=1437360 RepID=A0A1M7UY65_9BRAD|nr:glycosyltransferase family A protein [Bradyrhizobium erythrophlei]SHN87867.1 Glycosyltransferase like family 2 [Bradyrhizobium erythrophlei]